MHNTDESFEIASILKETGNLLKNDPEENATNLRNCTKEIHNLAIKSKNNNLIYLDYVLDVIVDDIWSNIGLDSSYRDFVRDEDSTKILSSIGDEFIELGDHLSRKDYYRSYDSCVRLLCGYLDDIADINRRLVAADEKSIRSRKDSV